jgi:hypothetical protein
MIRRRLQFIDPVGSGAADPLKTQNGLAAEHSLVADQIIR